MNEEKYILAHDHGTSGSKAAIVSIHGEVIGFEFEEVPLFLPSAGAAEQNPDDWWNAMKKTITRVLDKNLVSIDDIIGFCNTSQWSGTIPVDKEGNHLMNAIIWMDTRGAPYVEKFYKGILKVGGMNLIKALKYLHDNGIIHNDVKPDNIMIDNNLTPVLVDFGVSCSPKSTCSIDGVNSTCCKNVYGPNLCISPETLNNKAYFFQSDIWSLGITFYIVSTGGEYPFIYANNTKSLFNNIKTTDPLKLKTSNNILNNIVNRCLIKNPVSRIKLNEISDILG